MIPASFLSWVTFLGLVHTALVAPGAWLLPTFCTLLLLSNTLCLTIRQEKMFKSAKWAGKEELSKLTSEQKKKVVSAIRAIRLKSNLRVKVYILKGDEPNACACPMKEKESYVVGITSIGVQTWTMDELISVIAHEIGHLEYNHATKTVWTQFTLEAILYITMLSTAFGLSLLLKTFQQPTYLGWFGLAPIVFLVAPLGINIMRTRMQTMEFEADLYSATHYNKAAMISALNKITGSDEAHPEITDRINAISSTSEPKFLKS